MRALKRSKYLALSCLAVVTVVACTANTAEENTTNTLVTVTNMEGLPAEQTGTTTDDLFSDICSNDFDPFPTGCVAVNDFGQVTMRAEAKNLVFNVGVSQYNNVVFDRYRVTFTRADGRNTPGVDVPHPFDGVMQLFLPIGGGDQSVAFTMVRQQAKLEPPLVNLAGNGGAIVISTLARVDFYGKDMAGRAVSVTGYLNVNFGDF